MAVLEWDKVGEKVYETGINKAVFYKEDSLGIPWNGLTSLEYGYNDSVEEVYYDGIKFNDLVTLGSFSARLNAFTYPDEFLEYEGTKPDASGFYVTGQPKKLFGLSYQTSIGDDIEGIYAGYKIHVLYNLTAIPSDREYETLSLDVEPLEFEWELSSIPETVDFYRPTSHIIFDSRKFDPYLLAEIEAMLYGTVTTDAYLPSLQSLTNFVKNWGAFVITDHGDGTWTAYAAPDQTDHIIEMIDSESFEITTANAVFLDSDTYEISSSED